MFWLRGECGIREMYLMVYYKGLGIRPDRVGKVKKLQASSRKLSTL